MFNIEKVFLEHSYVSNYAVVPITDEITFQVPVAFIILNKEQLSNEDLKGQVQAYGEENLSDGYRPVKYIFVDKFPLTKVGKIDYIALEKEAEKIKN